MAAVRQSVSSPRTLVVLCVDDHGPGLAIRKTLLESFGYEVRIATTGGEALKIASQTRLDAVILDYRMPDMDGLQLARAFRERHPSLRLVVLSGFSKLPDELLSLADACICKGSDPGDLRQALADLLGFAPLSRRAAENCDPRLVANRAKDIVERSRMVVEESRKIAQQAAKAIARSRRRRA